MAAPAQDALRSALTLDRIADAQRATPFWLPSEDRPHLGPVQLAFGLYTAVEFNDNINLSENDAQDDIIVGTGFNADCFWPVTENSALRLNAGIGYSWYLQNSGYDRLELAPDSAMTWDVSFEDGGITFFDHFSYTRQVASDASLSGVAELPRFDNTAGARVRWLPGKWVLQTGYSHNNFFTDDTDQEYLNRESEYVFGRVGWRFAENTQVGLEASASLTDYTLETQSDSRSISLGPYAEWQVTRTFSATLRGGPTFYRFDSQVPTQSDDELNSYYAQVDLRHQLTDFISQQASAIRSVRLGLDQGSDYIEEFVGSYSVNWAATRRVGVGFMVLYEQGNQPLVGFGPENEEFQRFGFGPEFSMRLTDKLSTSLTYRHSIRESNFEGRDYDNHVVVFRLSYYY